MGALRRQPVRQQQIRQVFPEESWVEPDGSTSTIERLNVNDILVESYQREIKPYKLRKLIREWDPRAVGWVTISLRENGMLYAVDGQHRVEAVRHLQGKIGPYIDAVVVTGWSAQDEAHFFHKSQSPETRAAIMPEDTHRAAVYEGDPDALAIQQIVNRTGYRIGRDEANADLSRIKAVKSVNKVYEKFGGQVLADTLGFIGSTWGTRESPEQSLVAGVALFTVMYPQAKLHGLVKHVGKKSMDEWMKRARGRADNDNLSVAEGVASALRSDYNRANVRNQLPDFNDTLQDHRFSTRSAAMKRARS